MLSRILDLYPLSDLGTGRMITELFSKYVGGLD